MTVDRAPAGGDDRVRSGAPATAGERAPLPRGLDSRPSVLVTGASKGIGEACVHRLARDGFRVYAGVRREADGEALVRAVGEGVAPVLLDVTRAGEVSAVVARIDAETGERGLQALVNNAGIAVAGPLEYLPIDELRRQLEVNFVGQVAVTQGCLPLLRRARASSRGDHRAGRIVFMSSVAGRSAMPFVGAYAASKHAMEGAADALRVELRPFGLDVILVEPGVVTTPIWETSRRAGEQAIRALPAAGREHYGAVLDALNARAARGVAGLPPEKVAEAVSHALTSRRPRARYVVGRAARSRILMEALLPARVRDTVIAAAIRHLT